MFQITAELVSTRRGFIEPAIHIGTGLVLFGIYMDLYRAIFPELNTGT